MSAEPPAYNPIFTRFVPLETNEDEALQGLVAYGLYKIAKREWAREFGEKNDVRPTEAQLADYVATWTESRLRGLEEQAGTVLGTFADSVVETASPGILKEALRGNFLKSLGTSILAAFLYTLALIGLVVVLKVSGVDLLSIAGSIGAPPPAKPSPTEPAPSPPAGSAPVPR